MKTLLKIAKKESFSKRHKKKLLAGAAIGGLAIGAAGFKYHTDHKAGGIKSDQVLKRTFSDGSTTYTHKGKTVTERDGKIVR